MSKKNLAVVRPDKKDPVQEKIELIKASKRPNESLSKALERVGGVTEDQLGEYLSEKHQVPLIDLGQFDIDQVAISTLDGPFCRKNNVIPISKAGNTIVVAFADPGNLYVKDELAYLTKSKVEIVVALEKDIERAIAKYYPEEKVTVDARDILGEMDDNDVDDLDDLDEDADEADVPIIKFVNAMLKEAVLTGVSDIHIEVYEKSLRVRFRKDGQLVEKYAPPVNMGGAITARIKVMSKMDISERRRPQDGRIKLRVAGKGTIDFRVNALPVADGEKVVLRILDKSAVVGVELTSLGFSEDQLEVLMEAIRKPQGMVLVTGPTGSGKTTTLYASLQKIHDPSINISTAEDPVEFKIEGINQTQINHEIDFNFSSALRAFLRQDPDVILVGEIRDKETAEISFKAANTGHLVLSTLHTNDAPGTISRLMEMGVAGYVITSSLELILAQRLLRRICKDCKQVEKVDERVFKQLGISEDEMKNCKFYHGVGCDTCMGTGTKGRVGVYEFLNISHKVKSAILAGANPVELKVAAMKDGMQTLRQSAIQKAKEGVVSLPSVLTGTMKDPEYD